MKQKTSRKLHIKDEGKTIAVLPILNFKRYLFHENARMAEIKEGNVILTPKATWLFDLSPQAEAYIVKAC